MARFADGVQFVATSSGTGSFVVSAAMTGFQTPAGAGMVDGAKYKYRAESSDLTQWEIGEGVYTLSTTTLSRTTILFSSNSNAVVNFTAAPTVGVVALKEDMLAIDEANSFTATQQNQAQKNLAIAAILQGYISGLQMSAAGGTTTFSIGAGVAVDSTAADFMTLSSAITKTAAPFVAGTGNGALDTGTTAASTWYHVHEIKNVATQAVDVLMSLSVGAPTLPGGFTLFRRIGSIKLDASKNVIKFLQTGNTFLWDVGVTEINAGTLPVTSVTTQVLAGVPTGVKVSALIAGDGTCSAGAPTLWGWPADQTGGAGNLLFQCVANADFAGFNTQLMTDVNASIKLQNSSTINTINTFTLYTTGWIDNRGGNISAGGAAFTSQQLAPLQRGYIDGLILSTAGASATFSVSAGVANDSTNADVMTLAAAMSKTTAGWAAGTGNGGLDTGAIAASTWYHAHLIKTPGGTVDVLVSLSATAPTLPSGYTLFRRLGSMKTNGSSQWTSFTQIGDEFWWAVPVSDFSAVNNPGTTAVSRTLTVPTGARVKAFMSVAVQNSGTASQGAIMYLSDLNTTDTAAGSTVLTQYIYGNTAAVIDVGGSQAAIWTNTSAQVRSRMAYSDTNINFYIGTLGWMDPRGRNS